METNKSSVPIPKKNRHILVRLPEALASRLDYQIGRLDCSSNAIFRMALVRFLEEEEGRARKIESAS